MKDTKSKSKTKSEKGMGRPEKPIDWEKVDFFLLAGCTRARIAAAMGITDETLSDRFVKKYNMSYSTYSTLKHREGEAVLEAAQFHKAVKERNTQMQMWLGKVRLGQREPLPGDSLSEEIERAKSSNEALLEQIRKAQESHSARKMEETINKAETKS